MPSSRERSNAYLTPSQGSSYPVVMTPLLYTSLILYKSSSGGSDLGEGQDRIEMLAKGAKVLRGRRFNARASESDLKKWIETM